MKRIFNAALGFVAGIVSAPLAVVAWPFAVAIFMYNETDEEES